MVKPSDMREDEVVGTTPYVWLLGRFGGIRREREKENEVGGLVCRGGLSKLGLTF